MPVIVNIIKGTLGTCIPAETVVYSPNPLTTAIAVFVSTTNTPSSGWLKFVTGMEFGSGNFMDFQVSRIVIGSCHVEVWTLPLVKPANPTTIKFLAEGLPGLQDATFTIVEMEDTEPDRTKLVGFTNQSAGTSSDEISTPWVAEKIQSLIIDAYSLKGKSGMTKGAGQTPIYTNKTIVGKTQASTESALGFGPATWIIGATSPREYTHILLEMKVQEVIHDGVMDKRTEPATFDGDGDTEHNGAMNTRTEPATFDGTGDLERNGAMDTRTEPATFDGTGTVNRDGIMDQRTDPALFIGFGNNNTDHYGGMRARTEVATFDATGDVERQGTMDRSADPATFDGTGNTNKTGVMDARTEPATFDSTGDSERNGAMDQRTEVATLNGVGNVEHEGTMDVQTSAADFRGVGDSGDGTDLVGFDMAGRDFVVTIDSQYTGIRAQIIKSGSSSTIYVPSDGNSVVIRKLT